MAKLGTYCHRCGFLEDNQCTIGYLDAFKAAGATVTQGAEGPVIDRVCVARRDQEWIENHSLEDLHDEMYIRGSVMILVKSLEGLKNTLEKLRQIPKIERFSIIVVNTMDESCREFCEDIDFAEYLYIKTFLDDEGEITHDAFKRTKNGFLFILDSEENFDSQMIEKLNKAVNKDLKQVIHVKGRSGGHQSATISVLFRHVKGSLGMDISEKIEQIAKEQGVKFKVHDWGEL